MAVKNSLLKIMFLETLELSNAKWTRAKTKKFSLKHIFNYLKKYKLKTIDHIKITYSIINIKL